jgi:hypothetical protein
LSRGLPLMAESVRSGHSIRYQDLLGSMSSAPCHQHQLHSFLYLHHTDTRPATLLRFLPHCRDVLRHTLLRFRPLHGDVLPHRLHTKAHLFVGLGDTAPSSRSLLTPTPTTPRLSLHAKKCVFWEPLT